MEIEKYTSVFKNFVAEMLESEDYDFIVLNDRKGAKFFEYMGLFSLNGQHNKRKIKNTLYRGSFRFVPSSEIKGSNIAIFDEITQHGNTLFYARNFFEKMINFFEHENIV